ncbi:patatin-like phospholipase family protein [Trinickia fusca]|uniref:Patatin n=1 Tax=Trinickia fusca TaxID=2419777 RepID=A0A494X0P3_9BURK|nr:patatin-like phospholipase family protein [Trinickia fusca]RKP43872.1 patatin [Trinickia fusca]
MSTFKILSLDGGGTWALIQVRALQKIYGDDATGHEVLSHFNLVSANSGGSLVLGGLIENLPLSEIGALFSDANQRSKIFVPLGIIHLIDKVLEATLHLGPKYSTSRKLLGIQAALPKYGATPLNELPASLANGRARPRILIPTFDYDLRRETFFRSDTNSLANGMIDKTAPTVAEAIHASTNAPINYFDQPAQFPSSPTVFGSHRYWDGAVAGYNNPVLAAVTETLANQSRYDVDPSQLRVLSIGTGNTSLPLVERGSPVPSATELVVHPQTPWLAADIAEMATSIMSDPPDAATYIAHVMLGGAVSCDPQQCKSGLVVRMNPLIRPICKDNAWVLPSGLSDTDFARLVKLDMDATNPEDVKLIDHFCAQWIQDAVPNQAVRANERFETLIGQDLFSSALKAWRDFGA